ncbi:MAG: 23S rRNA (uracil(1939)-C(5))-methyltransferase RlmD [Vulcanimicrobiaceae bacterium]
MTNSATAHPRVPLQLGAHLELAFDDLLANGQAVGRADGLAVFVFGPLPGEIARVRVMAVKKNYAVGDLVELVRESPDRAQPFCPVFGQCGGCQVQHLAYSAQLAWKRRVVENALSRIGGFTGCTVSPTAGMPQPRQYRNKMSLVVQRRGARSIVGFYKQRSHDVVRIDGCPIVRPRLDTLIAKLNEWCSTSADPAVRQLRHIVARGSDATAEVLLTLTTARPLLRAPAVAREVQRSMPEATGLINSYDLRGENAIFGRKTLTLAGAEQIEDEIEGLRYRLSATSFFQVNVAMVAEIFRFLRPYVSDGMRIVDLYCGVGTFALYFAKLGARVLGIEEHPSALAEARANAQRNTLQGSARFEMGRVEDALNRRGSELRAAHAVFLDPPRKGSDQKTLGAIAAAAVPNVWYLSCDPATLARDLKFLAAKGYHLDVVQPFDMFPQTGHVETFAALTREATAATPGSRIP